MALTVNPHAGPSAPDTFHEEALYAFRFDLNCDSHEDVTFKVQFGASAQVDGNEHQHTCKRSMFVVLLEEWLGKERRVN